MLLSAEGKPCSGACGCWCACVLSPNLPLAPQQSKQSWWAEQLERYSLGQSRAFGLLWVHFLIPPMGRTTRTIPQAVSD